MLSIFSTILKVEAKENDTYYINNNGVSFTEREYNFISQFYWEGYQDDMSLTDYEEFINSDIINGEIKSVERKYYDDNIASYSTSHKTNSKLIKITSSCTSTCDISVVVNWSTMPNTKSYDVIGAYLDGVSLKINPKTIAKTTSANNSSDEIKKYSNGFGVSILLPSSGNSYVINQTYTVSKGGTVYASYQHAKSSISLANSKNYTISKDGYGGVFKFTGTASSVYDGMGGVSISV